ncbi:hypothetical protein MRB53_041766 [Persea americana]|nr:hypothetical protein MRB53_041766 [Persea americana]
MRVVVATTVHTLVIVVSALSSRLQQHDTPPFPVIRGCNHTTGCCAALFQIKDKYTNFRGETVEDLAPIWSGSAKPYYSRYTTLFRCLDMRYMRVPDEEVPADEVRMVGWFVLECEEGHVVVYHSWYGVFDRSTYVADDYRWVGNCIPKTYAERHNLKYDWPLEPWVTKGVIKNQKAVSWIWVTPPEDDRDVRFTRNIVGGAAINHRLDADMAAILVLAHRDTQQMRISALLKFLVAVLSCQPELPLVHAIFSRKKDEPSCHLTLPGFKDENGPSVAPKPFPPYNFVPDDVHEFSYNADKACRGL